MYNDSCYKNVCDHTRCTNKFESRLDSYNDELRNNHYFDAIIEKKIRSMPKVGKQINKIFSNVSDFEYYAITFTLRPDDNHDHIYLMVDKFLSSKMFSSAIDSYVRVYELTDKGVPHAHLFVKCTRNIYVSDILKLNCMKGRRIELKCLRTPLDVERWNNYLKKCKDTDVEYFGGDQYLEWSTKNTDIVQDVNAAIQSINELTTESQ